MPLNHVIEAAPKSTVELHRNDHGEFGSKRSSDRTPPLTVIENRYIRCRLTMRLSDAGLRRRPTEPLYANHRPSPWPNEDAAP